MSFTLPQRCLEWQQRVRAFVDEELIPWETHAELNGGTLPEDIQARHRDIARELELHAIDTPREYGGLALPMLDQAVISEQIGRVTNALGWCFPLPQRWMFEACSREQIEHWILPVFRGERHECYAISEEHAGSDTEAIRATARRDGDHYRIDGEKWFVTGANLSDFAFVQARIDGGENDGAHALFIVELDRDGVDEVGSPAFSHTYAAHHPMIRFRDVRVPVDQRVGDEGDGMDFTRSWFRYERLMIAARCCGAAERLIDEATRFAEERVVSGRPIADYQAIQFMLADSLTELWAARLMTWEAADAHDRGADVKVLHGRCSMAKLYASEMANRVADRVLQIFGGRGYMRENPAERFFRELRVDRIWEGTSEIQRLIIARALRRRGRESLVG